MVMIEAMSAGLPVVTFDYKCGPRDIITSGKDGVIVAYGDNNAFAEALLMLIADADLRRTMGRNAVEVTDRYSEDRVMGMWADLFGQIVKE